MLYDRSLENARPPRRFPPQTEVYTEAQIQEAPDVGNAPGTFSTIETIDLALLPGGLDSDARYPAYRHLTTDAGVLASGWLRVLWVNQDTSTAISNAVRFFETTTASDGAYCTADELRTDLDLSSTDMTDATANAVIQDACDLIDSELGARPIDDVTGRKVVQDDVEGWQWDKINRATRKVAAILHASPKVGSGQQYDRVKGPDFEFWGRQGSSLGSTVGALLDASGLRRLTTTTGHGWSRPPWYGFSYGATEN